MNPSEALPSELSEPLARASRRLGIFDRRVTWYAEVTSTNDVAMLLADRAEPEGTVIVADLQTAGRGRHGRVWASPACAGVYFSAILRPHDHALPLVTLAAGLAAAEGIQAATGLEPGLKWPNDIYAGHRKLAGILAEAGSSRQGAHHVVLGIGVNVRATAFPPDVAQRATSLEAELGKAVDRGLLLAECLAALAARYAELQAGRLNAVLDGWRGRAASTFGRIVEWETGGAGYRGLADDVDSTGALIVRTDTGLERVISGELRWL